MKVINLIILGAGDSSIEIVDIIDDINKKKSEKINIVGILDDNKNLKNKKISKIPILGRIKDIYNFKKENFFLTLFSSKNRFVRAKLITKLKKIHNRFINIVHPNSLISSNSKIGNGCLISNNCNIYTGSNIGNFCTILPDVSIAPKTKIYNNCFIGKSAILSSKSKIHKNTYIGFQSSLLENVKVGEGSRILPNTIVNKSINRKKGVIYGYPAKIIAYDK